MIPSRTIPAGHCKILINRLFESENEIQIWLNQPENKGKKIIKIWEVKRLQCEVLAPIPVHKPSK